MLFFLILNIFFVSCQDDEKYSLLKIKKLKSAKFSPYKSTNHLYNKIENAFDEEKNDSKFLYFNLKKQKKIYTSNITFVDENNNKKEFQLFRDSDIGLGNTQKVIKQLVDFDVESDEETINDGQSRCFQNIRSAIKEYNRILNKNKKHPGGNKTENCKKP